MKILVASHQSLTRVVHWTNARLETFFFSFFVEIKFIKTNKTELHRTIRRDALKSNNIINNNWESPGN